MLYCQRFEKRNNIIVDRGVRSVSIIILIVVLILAGCIDNHDQATKDCLVGDINLNGSAYEREDASLFSQYFIYGIDVFKINRPEQIAASDINGDGFALTLDDIVEMITKLAGDSLPATEYFEVTDSMSHLTQEGIFSVEIPCFAAHLIVSGVTTPPGADR